MFFRAHPWLSVGSCTVALPRRQPMERGADRETWADAESDSPRSTRGMDEWEMAPNDPRDERWPAEGPVGNMAADPAAEARDEPAHEDEEEAAAPKKKNKKKGNMARWAWLTKMSPEEFRVYCDDNPMTDLDGHRHYKVIVEGNGGEWHRLGDDAGPVYIAVWLRGDRHHDDVWASDENGRRRSYTIWWIGGHQGAQKNNESGKVRLLKIVPCETEEEAHVPAQDGVRPAPAVLDQPERARQDRGWQDARGGGWGEPQQRNHEWGAWNGNAGGNWNHNHRARRDGWQRGR